MLGKEINHITEKDFESILRYRLYGKSLTSGRTLMGKQTLNIKVPYVSGLKRVFPSSVLRKPPRSKSFDRPPSTLDLWCTGKTPLSIEYIFDAGKGQEIHNQQIFIILCSITAFDCVRISIIVMITSQISPVTVKNSLKRTSNMHGNFSYCILIRL